MKRGLFFLAVAFFVVATASWVHADVAGSHHDMKAWTGAANGDSCYPCHGLKESGAGTASLGRVGSLCYIRCHAQDGGAAGNITLDTAMPEKGQFDNTSFTIVYPGGSAPGYASGTTLHKYEAHRFVKASIPAPDAALDVTNTNWPYAAELSMECTTCHDVHTNTFTPFLRSPLSTGDASAFCQKCHASTSTDGTPGTDGRRFVLISNLPNGSHPVEVNYAGAAGRSGTGRLGRTIVFKDSITSGAGENTAVFRNGSLSGTAMNSNANHYNPGGKFGEFGSTGTTVGCYTCHATHMPSEANMSQLLVVAWRGALVAQNDLCAGCHGAAGSDGRNPGITNYFHPVNGDCRPVNTSVPSAAVYQVTTGTFNITVNLDNTTNSATLELGAGGRILCSNCHGITATGSSRGVHGSLAGENILNPAKNTCGSCHNPTSKVMGTTPNSHHVYGGATDYTGVGYPSTVTYSSGRTATLSNGLSCEDCHLFNGTAHNWN